MDGYGGNFIQLINDLGGMYPSAVGGSSTTKLTDQFYTQYDNLAPGYTTDWRVVRVGGCADNGATAGVFCVAATDDSSIDLAHLGARLCLTL